MAATQGEVSSTSAKPQVQGLAQILLDPTVQVMKMVMPLLSPAAGKLIFQLPEGSILNSNDLIARLELDSPDAVVAAEQFRGTFPELGPPQVSSHGVDHRFQQARTAAQMTLAGERHADDFGFDQASICPLSHLCEVQQDHCSRQACTAVLRMLML